MLLKEKRNLAYIIIALFAISCQQKSSTDQSISVEQHKTFSGTVVPSKNLLAPEVFSLKEINAKGYTPEKISRIDKREAIQPTKKFEFILQASTELIPGEAFYPITNDLISEPKLMRKPRVGFKTRQKYTDGKTILFSEQDGMEIAGVNALVQGPKGAIWGCSRYGGIWNYDGYKFSYYDETTGLNDYAVSNLFFDSDGDLWIGMSNGLAKFDGKHIIHYTGENEISKNNPTRLCEDQYGNIWVGSLDGLYKINKQTNEISFFNEEQGLQQNSASSLFTDHLGRIWMTYNNGGFSVLNIQKENDHYQYRIDNYNTGTNFNLKLVQQVIENSKQQICILTNQDLILIETDSIYPDHIPAISYATKKNFNTAIAEDRNGRLWLSGLYSISVLDADASSDYNYSTEKDYYALRQKSITSILIDKDGFLWMGLENQGLNRIKIETPLHSIKENFGVSGLSNLPVEDQWGNLWFYTAYSGLHCLKKSNEGNPIELLHYKRSIFNDMHSPMNMIIDRDNAIWMANRFALFKIKLFNNGDSIAVTQIQEESEMVLNHPHFLHEDREGNIWITENTLSLTNKNLNSRGGGIYKLNNNTLYKYGTAQGLLANDTYTICEDNEGAIWLNNLYRGLTRFEPNYKENPLGRWTHFNTKNDFQKRPYAITKHPKNGIFIHVNPRTIFVESSDSPEILNVQGWSQKVLHEKNTTDKKIVTNTILGSDNRYWFGYQKGIASVEMIPNASSANKPITEKYSLLDGFSDSDIRYIKEDQNGIIWTIGKNDVIGINPQVLDRQSIQPNTQLTSLKQGDQNYSIPNELDLTFNYQENYIDFEFHTIDVNRNHQLEYRYKLDGYENSWNIPTKLTNTSYPNLPHGAYTFMVSSRLGNGEWGIPATIDFTIQPPWWQSKVAYILYTLFSLLAMTWIWRNQLNRIRVQNQIEKELLEAEKIREIDEVKTRFFTNISHEYRTPLTVILGMTEELKEDNVAKKLIKQSGRNLLRLVNQMLDFNKMEEGKLTLNLKSGELISFAQYLLESYQSLAEHKNIKLHFESSIKALHMPFDEDKIQHIISNLLSNAIKFTPPNGQVVVQLSEASNQLTIKVKDNGIGIPEKDIPHIFDRFFQIKNELSQEQAGTGIGLNFTKELVEMMDGGISVQSEIDQGSTFTVLLPIPEEGAKIPHSNQSKEFKRKVSYEGIYQDPKQTFEKEDISKGLESNLNPQLLLIEDNPEVVAYIKNVLENDYEITVAFDGKIGIEKALQNIPDIIITDVMMPFKNGYEVTTSLKKDERTSHIPIIMLTAKADHDSKIEGLESGANAYLAKPFNKKELKIRLNNMVELSKKYQKKYSRVVELPTTTTIDNTTNVIDLENAFLQKVNVLIDQNMENAGFLVDELSIVVGMNRSQLYRKLKALTGKSTVAYLRSRRLHEAHRLLLIGELNVSEVGYEVGFSSPSYFSKAFSTEFGHSPTEIKNKKNPTS